MAHAHTGEERSRLEVQFEGCHYPATLTGDDDTSHRPYNVVPTGTAPSEVGHERAHESPSLQDVPVLIVLGDAFDLGKHIWHDVALSIVDQLRHRTASYSSIKQCMDKATKAARTLLTSAAAATNTGERVGGPVIVKYNEDDSGIWVYLSVNPTATELKKDLERFFEAKTRCNSVYFCGHGNEGGTFVLKDGVVSGGELYTTVLDEVCKKDYYPVVEIFFNCCYAETLIYSASLVAGGTAANCLESVYKALLSSGGKKEDPAVVVEKEAMLNRFNQLKEQRRVADNIDTGSGTEVADDTSTGSDALVLPSSLSAGGLDQGFPDTVVGEESTEEYPHLEGLSVELTSLIKNINKALPTLSITSKKIIEDFQFRIEIGRNGLQAAVFGLGVGPIPAVGALPYKLRHQFKQNCTGTPQGVSEEFGKGNVPAPVKSFGSPLAPPAVTSVDSFLPVATASSKAKHNADVVKKLLQSTSWLDGDDNSVATVRAGNPSPSSQAFAKPDGGKRDTELLGTTGPMLAIYDVGCGDCTVLSMPRSDGGEPRVNVLIDGGYGGKGSRKKAEHWWNSCVGHLGHLDLLVITHSDDDHILGIKLLTKGNGSGPNFPECSDGNRLIVSKAWMTCLEGKCQRSHTKMKEVSKDLAAIAKNSKLSFGTRIREDPKLKGGKYPAEHIGDAKNTRVFVVNPSITTFEEINKKIEGGKSPSELVNRASICILVLWWPGNKPTKKNVVSMLFTADADPKDICEGLIALKEVRFIKDCVLDKDDNYHLTYAQIPHHGSTKKHLDEEWNVSKALERVAKGGRVTKKRMAKDAELLKAGFLENDKQQLFKTANARHYGLLSDGGFSRGHTMWGDIVQSEYLGAWHNEEETKCTVYCTFKEFKMVANVTPPSEHVTFRFLGDGESRHVIPLV